MLQWEQDRALRCPILVQKTAWQETLSGGGLAFVNARRNLLGAGGCGHSKKRSVRAQPQAHFAGQIVEGPYFLRHRSRPR